MPLYIWTALNCILKRGFLQCDISSSHIVTNKRIYFWYFFHHLCCCWSVEKLVIRVLCLFWRKVLLKGCIKPASINPPTAPKQSSSQSPSQRLQPLNTEQRRQELPLNLKHTIILSLPFSLSHTHTKTDIHAYTYSHAINYTKWNSTHLRGDLSSQNTNSIRRAATHSLSAGKMDHLWALQATSQWHCLGLILTTVVNCILNLCSALSSIWSLKSLFVRVVSQTSVSGCEKSHFISTKPY